MNVNQNCPGIWRAIGRDNMRQIFKQASEESNILLFPGNCVQHSCKIKKIGPERL